jgi:hypothetical protein
MKRLALLISGVILGLTVYSIAPDLRRYMKMISM